MKLPGLNVSQQQRWRHIDHNTDGVLQSAEIRDYLAATGDLRPGSDLGQLERELRASFSVQRKPGYTSYDQASQKLQELAQRFPHWAERVEIGKSAEGRSIWALRMGTAGKPGVVITGCHHAREWMTVEVPLDLAVRLLEGSGTDPAMKKRLENTEIWVVPMVNPDGYEYSRNEDSWWRKSRRPIEETGCPMPKPPADMDNSPWAQTPMGVDLNRNYFHPNNPELYRSPGDKKCSYQDDPSHTSDAPRSDTYRGPAGASEPETAAMQKLVLGRDNIRGVIDYHSHGNLILYPWGHKAEPPTNLAEYQALGQKMNQALGGDYRVQSSMDLYPTHGTSSDLYHAHGKLAYTFEIGSSFQPPVAEIAPMMQKLQGANLAFIDHFQEH